MDAPLLIVGNRNYSSWSMRPWVLLRQLRIPFLEKTIWLDEADADEQKRAWTPAGRVPVLVLGGVSVWDSLAIVETLAERFPDHGIWPADRAARARARSLCAEMHAGFLALRAELPMNCRARGERRLGSAELRADLQRIEAIWAETPAEFDDGPFLLGEFCAVDAFFAPVATRCRTYDVELGPAAAAYRDRLLAADAVVEWCTGAEVEEHRLERVEALL